jgi:hypothetical protein
MTVYLAVAQSSNAGIITAWAGVITAVSLLLTSLGVILPQLLRLRRQGAATNEKLDVIHTLVNSTLTASVESDLAATRQSLDLMLQLVAAQREHGEPTAPETLAAIAGARVKLDGLVQQVADRLRTAQAVIDASAKRGLHACSVLRLSLLSWPHDS